MDDLLAALNKGNHEKYLEQPEQVKCADAVAEGNRILGHVLGNKETSRRVAERASQQTGIGSDVLKQLLPLVATMVMGALSNQSGRRSVLHAWRRCSRPTATAAWPTTVGKFFRR